MSQSLSTLATLIFRQHVIQKVKLPVVRDELEKFGPVEVHGVSDGYVVVHIETTLDSAETVENLARTIDNMSDASLGIAGNDQGDALIEVRLKYGAFDVIPPYLQEK